MTHDETERALSDALRRKADQMSDNPLDMDDVRQRAGRVRRNRRVAVGAALAAGVVILLPVGINAVRGSGDGPTPPPATTSPTPTTSPTAEPTDSPSPEPTGPRPFDLSGLEQGAAPAIPWAEVTPGDGGSVHGADGSTAEGVLPEGVTGFAPMGSGWLVAASTDGVGSVQWIGGDGTPADTTYDLDGGLVSSPGGAVVAWTTPEGVPMVVQDDGSERFEMPAIGVPGGYDTVAVTSEDCVEGRTSDAGCSVYVNAIGEQQQAWVSSSHGFADVAGEEFTRITAVHESLVAGITSVDEAGETCSAVRRTGQQKPLWKTCDHRLTGFSPDGALVMGVGSYGDGFADGQATIRDAEDGTVLVDLLSDEDHHAGVLQMRWEDDSHLLMVVYADQEWSIVRLASDGSMEYAVAPQPGADIDRPFYLAS